MALLAGTLACIPLQSGGGSPLIVTALHPRGVGYTYVLLCFNTLESSEFFIHSPLMLTRFIGLVLKKPL